jgi:hypothetical protein
MKSFLVFGAALRPQTPKNIYFTPFSPQNEEKGDVWAEGRAVSNS